MCFSQNQHLRKSSQIYYLFLNLPNLIAKKTKYLSVLFTFDFQKPENGFEVRREVDGRLKPFNLPSSLHDSHRSSRPIFVIREVKKKNQRTFPLISFRFCCKMQFSIQKVAGIISFSYLCKQKVLSTLYTSQQKVLSAFYTFTTKVLFIFY